MSKINVVLSLQKFIEYRQGIYICIDIFSVNVVNFT